MNTEESKDSFLYLNIDFNKSIILDENLIAIYCVFWIKDNEARYMANMGERILQPLNCIKLSLS